MTVGYEVDIYDYEGKRVSSFSGTPITVNPQETAMLEAYAPLENIHFWSWGYGYLYHVVTRLIVDNKSIDEVVTTTGFRKTRFAGKYGSMTVSYNSKAMRNARATNGRAWAYRFRPG